jgi:glucosamine--fructose-6-phosphate aminotransferase (isomerizing)
MCGIVGAVAKRNVVPLLIDGLKRLEYRGYDSAGIAIVLDSCEIERLRKAGKVYELETSVQQTALMGTTGIAHTRWATHGKPTEQNAHPHISNDSIAVVHNGIIENYLPLKNELIKKGYRFTSETDTEVISHLIHDELKRSKDLLRAVQIVVKKLEGAYALGVVDRNSPHRIIAVRLGSPLVVGLGHDENFIASDPLALLPVTHRFIYLDEGDVADIHLDKVTIFDKKGKAVKRKTHISEMQADIANKGKYRHFMLKEIFEQPNAVQQTIQERIGKNQVLEQAFGVHATKMFDQIKRVQLVACGTSYHACLVARYWLESLANIPCHVEIASEFRYRHKVVEPNTLFVTLSQSGETADTLAALRQAKELKYQHTLAICNVPQSSLVRESEFVFMTRAGMEIGVASTKAFTTQLVALFMLTLVLGRRHGLDAKTERQLIKQLQELPNIMERALKLNDKIKVLSERFAEKQNALFLGRGMEFPIAMEGALKLKEISYIHAEAYAAGELKHGPLALVDKNMPVIAIAPNDELLEKLTSNLQEVRARGGELIVFADETIQLKSFPDVTIISMPAIHPTLAPIMYTLPLQLLAYHIAVLKGTDVDQPRNLAKSVTVE